MALGPLDFVVLAFPGERIGPDALAAVERVRRSDDIRLIDSLIVVKSAGGEVDSLEIADVPELSAAYHGHDLVTLIDAEDAQEVARALRPGTVALALLVEHRWAKDVTDNASKAGGELLATVRIRPEHAEEAERALNDRS